MTPFSLLTSVSVAAGYALLGATWLVMKAEGRLQQQARTMAGWLGGATLAAIVAVSLATPFLSAAYFDTWLRWPAIQAPRDDASLPPLRVRLMWTAFIWACSVTALLVVTLLLRVVLR